MSMHFWDWSIIGALLTVVFVTGFFAKRLVRNPADFLSANRCGGRYLMTVAEGMSGFSALAILANYEKFFAAGFPALWWGALLFPLGLIIALSGYNRYRFRETRALTMAQFFEMRYTRRFRIFAGIVTWISGLLNYGIFPGVTARLLIHFCGLPKSFAVFGFTFLTFPIVVIVLLGMALYLTLNGGQIAVMITDFIQGQFATIVLVVLSFFLLLRFDWSVIMESLLDAPAHKSMLNPYDQSEVADFSLAFFLMQAWTFIYGYMSWQGSQGYYSAARNPHEAKMATIVGTVRARASDILWLLPPLLAFAVLRHPSFAADADVIQTGLNAIGDAQAQIQMRTPAVLAHFLPTGMLGLFAALAISAALTTDDTYLHSWGSIFIQDVIMPFRKNPLTPKQHLRWLRWSIFGMAVAVFFYSLFFPVRQYIFMYWQITGAVYIGGAGAAIVGGLYWSRGTTAAAWAAMISGAILAVVSLMLQTFWSSLPWLNTLAPKFPYNGMQMFFATTIFCGLLYVVVSLATCRKPFNMDWLLHRGRYAVQGEHQIVKQRLPWHWRLIGADREFTLFDRLVAGLAVAAILFWTVLLIGGHILTHTIGVSPEAWARFWMLMVWSGVTLAGVTTLWIVVGGIRDARCMIRDLRCPRDSDAHDDGRVNRPDDI
jgi:solute:Na+ symporter, SSS family